MRRALLISALSALALAAYAQAPIKTVTDLKGRTMPAFSMKTITGTSLTNANTKGKVVLLDFWASWCGPCKLASPTMQSLHKSHAAKGLIVVGVNGLENKKGPDAAKAYQKKNSYGYTFTYDNDPLIDKLKIEGVPTFIVVDRKGKVAFVAKEWSEKVKADLTKAVAAAVAAK